MSYLLNYKTWRSIHESVLLEAKNSSLTQTGIGSLYPVEKGNKIYDISDGEHTPEWGWLDPENSGLFFETLSNTVGFGGIPVLYIHAGNTYRYGYYAGSNKTKDPDSLMDVFKLLICGIGRYHGIENLGDQMVEGIDGKTAQTRLTELGLTVKLVDEIQLYGKAADKIDASALITEDGSVLDSSKPINSNSYRNVLNYINTFNLINFAEGNSQQYVDLAACVDDKNVLQLAGKAEGVSVNETSLYLYSPKKGTVTAGSEETVTTTTQGKAGLKDTLNLAFEPLKFATAKTDKGETFPVDSTNPQIQDVANKILAALGESQQITQMTLVSGASPNWQGKPVPESNGSGDPSGGKLNDTNFAAEKSALGNEWLAWRRGREFANALEELLGAKRIAANALTIEWKVSATGAEGGRNLAYSVASTGTAPKETTETVFAGASYKVGGAAHTFYRYKFTWNYANIAKSQGGWLKKLFGKQTKATGDVNIGDTITYREMESDGQGGTRISKRLTKTAEVVKVVDAIPYVLAASGKELKIGADRFVSGGTQIKAGKAVEE